VIDATLIVGLVMLFVVGVASLCWTVFQRSAIHSAVDQGSRAGALVPGDGAATCEARIRQVLGNILARASGVSVGCADDGEVVVATVGLRLRSWIPGTPDTTVTATGLSRKERLP